MPEKKCFSSKTIEMINRVKIVLDEKGKSSH